MDLPAIIFALVMTITLLSIDLGILRGKLSPLFAAIIVALETIIFVVVDVLIRRGIFLEMICEGSLLTVALAPAVYIFGRLLEKKVKERSLKCNK